MIYEEDPGDLDNGAADVTEVMNSCDEDDFVDQSNPHTSLRSGGYGRFRLVPEHSPRSSRSLSWKRSIARAVLSSMSMSLRLNACLTRPMLMDPL